MVGEDLGESLPLPVATNKDPNQPAVYQLHLVKDLSFLTLVRLLPSLFALMQALEQTLSERTQNTDVV
jgi:hypothetical protein